MPRIWQAAIAANGPHLSGETVVLPLVMIKGYPFVDGTINGRSGKLLFDTGSAPGLVIDSHVISPPGAVVTGNGFFGSGQTYQTMRFPLIDTLTLPGGLRFTAMRNIRGNPGLPLERHITPEFIGWLGLGFFSGYVAKLDYSKPAVTFYRNDASGSGMRAATVGEESFKAIPLGNPEHRDIPTYPAKIETMDLIGVFDSGSHNTAWLSDQQIGALERAGNLHADAQGNYTVSGLSIDGYALPPMPLEIIRNKPAIAEFLPRSGTPVLVLGYELLSLYPVVLDYDRATMTLLKPKPVS